MSDQLTLEIEPVVALVDPGRGFRKVVDSALLPVFARALRPAHRGHLRVALPSGRTAVFGRGGGVEASLAFTSYGAMSRVLTRGLMGFAEAYIAGDAVTARLHDFFDFFLDNEAAIFSAWPRLTRASKRDSAYHDSRHNSRTGSRRNIEAHYDLGNEFYRLWLDPGMSYSSAIYANADASLEDAQAEKHNRIIDALDLKPGHSVLEIGCGWGGLAADMATRGADVSAITISQQQYAVAGARLAAVRGARVLFEDYRDTTGSYDRIASVEMIEAVGEDHWPAYFRVLSDRLKPGGIAVIQAITIREDLFEDYRRKPDFIQRYIFPGGMLPTVGLIRQHAEAAGLIYAERERFGASYAMTLAEWRRRFSEAWPRIETLGFDARFRRMWEYYLTYCEVGFQRGIVDVGIYALSKPGTTDAVPGGDSTRAK